MNRILTCILCLISLSITAQSTEIVNFSHITGFYNSSFYLKVTPVEGELFYYNENNIKKNFKSFPDSLLIEETTNFSLYLKQKDTSYYLGSFSYFIGFKTKFKVVSISIDNNQLWDTYKGIYVKGPYAHWDTTSEHYRNVNWERKWEKENYIEIFNEDGERIVSQNSGLRIFGGMTKYYPEKSLRVIARSQYGKSRFDADIFNKGEKKYKQFILRHSGNDYRKTRFKDVFCTSIANESELDVQSFSPTHLFVNSEYWGVYNIREKINKYYIDNNHNSVITSVDILQGYRTVESGTQESYNKLLKFVEKNDLSDTENYLEVKKMMDTRNFINFWIHQIYFANHDARGNIRFWKSDSLDGKFRWIVYDTDLGFSPSNMKENTLRDFTNPRMTDWFNPRWATSLLRNLLENKDFKKDFVLQSSILLNSTLSSDYLLQRLDDFQSLYKDEMKIHFTERKKFQRNQGDIKKWENHINDLKIFASNRDIYSFIHLEQKFKLKKPCHLYISIENFEDGEVFINQNKIEQNEFHGTFYEDFKLPINISPNIGYSYNEGIDTLLSFKSGDTLNLKIGFYKNLSSSSNVIINEVDYVNDCFELYNQSEKKVNLDRWKIIDGNNNLFKIKEYSLEKNRFAVFHFNDILDKIDTVTYVKIDFRLSSKNELIFIYDDKERLVDSVKYKIDTIKTSYSRNIPIDSFEKIKIVWKNIKESSIGEHNSTFILLKEKVYKREREQKIKRRLILFSSIVGVLVSSLFFLIKRRRKKKSTLQL